MQKDTITSIVNKHLQRWIDLKLNSTPATVPVEMLAAEQDYSEGWTNWLPVKSEATDEEIAEVEKQIDCYLPQSFKTFIKHKHFYELYIEQAHFMGYVSGSWQKGVTAIILDGYPEEFLVDKGYIPFANYGDWGVLCFDINQMADDNEYPVVLWDHDVWEEFQPFSENFTAALIELDKKDDASQL